MTTPNVSLPEPGFPMLTILITDNFVDLIEEVRNERGEVVRRQPKQLLHWAVSKPHPFVEGMSVVRMFNDRGGIEVYSWDGTACMRDFIPMARVRDAQEAMPIAVFIDELSAAESDDPSDEGDAGDDEEGDEDADPDQPQATAAPNGQPSP